MVRTMLLRVVGRLSKNRLCRYSDTPVLSSDAGGGWSDLKHLVSELGRTLGG